LFWLLHSKLHMKLFEHLQHGFNVNIVDYLFHEWVVSFSNAKGVCHLVFFIIWWMSCGWLRCVDNAKNCNPKFLKNHKKSTMILLIFLRKSYINCKVSMVKVWSKLLIFQESFCIFKALKIYLYIVFILFYLAFVWYIRLVNM
jgi:hypothetical protein